ncbi:LysR family nitrogen assimilation transcriptional regulator [Cupriavidus alkaliphilus]|uniref:LysR family transcriptional regulator n=1 Tax=Cupriavidus alkaliphilus TaxID=942866 RepID=UPI000DE7AA67|nr:LysR family transcriptional regulator [Cupriavidus alkaliphilus]PVY60733.1 LysR family nitrogen assimilation transcriptional regulator [Cupriavidus alkaliphilus]
MDLRQLRYFKALATLQHFGRASAALHIAQPALSRQIRLLEEELGVRLLERHVRGATPTPEGLVLLDRASFLLRYADQVKVDIADLAASPRGLVALGLTPALAPLLFIPLAEALREQYPEIRLRLVENFAPALQDALLQGTLDVALLSGPVSSPGVSVVPLVAESLCAIGPWGDAALGDGPVDIEQLRGLPMILTGVPKSGVRLALEALAARQGLELQVTMEVESIEVARRLVARGFGWTVHFAAAIREELEAQRLQAVAIRGLELQRMIGYAAARPPSRASLAVMETLRGVATALTVEGKWPHSRLLGEMGDGS